MGVPSQILIQQKQQLWSVVCRKMSAQSVHRTDTTTPFENAKRCRVGSMSRNKATRLSRHALCPLRYAIDIVRDADNINL